MEGDAEADTLLRERGERRDLDAFVVAAAFSADSRVAAFALGDGTLRLAATGAEEEWRRIAVHDGVVLALAPDVAGEGFLSGGDDGGFRRTKASSGETSEIARFKGRWVEHVAGYRGAKGQGLVAVAVGRAIHLFDGAGAEIRTFEHPSTVSGVAFDRKGKRIGASHYDGVSLWFVQAKTQEPRRLEWKGSHTAIAIHPDGDAVVTAMQENALHGWRLSDSQHMRMSGYPGKTESLSFSARGRWLATSGAEAIVLWPFFGGGPMGKAPRELAGGDGVSCARVACHPEREIVAAGFADGLVVLADIASEHVLPVAAAGRGSVSALAWSPDGKFLAFGTEDGFAAIVNVAKR